MNEKLVVSLSLIGIVILLCAIPSTVIAKKAVVLPLHGKLYVMPVEGATKPPSNVPTVVSKTGRVWMDRNLGANKVATSMTDTEAYGDLYQWGRLTDGHEKRNSGTTTTLSNSDTPGHGDFITNNSESPYSPFDWRSPQNNNLWQGVSGI